MQDQPAENTSMALVRRLFLEGFSKNNADVLREVLAEDFVLTSAGGSSEQSGRETLIAGMKHNHTAFQGWGFVIEHIMQDQQHVAVRWTASGKHVGSFAGEDPTGKAVTLKGNSIYRVEGDKIQQDWVFANQLDFQKQLGVGAVPTPAIGEQLVHRFWEEVINAHAPDRADDLMSPGYVQHAEGIAQGPEGFKAFFREVLDQSQGMRAEVKSVMSLGELVISATTITFDKPPPGWQDTQNIVDVFRTDGRLLTEHWDLRV